MKKHVLALAVLGAFGLAGCGGDGPTDPTESPLPPGVSLTKAVFESSDSDGDGYTIPLPNDLLFAPTSCNGVAQPNTDLTLNIPCRSDAELPTTLAQVGAQNLDPTAGAKRGQAALSKLDGWSTTAPFVVKFANAVNTDADANNNVKLAPATVVAGTTVRLFEVSTNRSEVAPSVLAPTGPVTSVVAELTANDFAVEIAPDDASGMTVRVMPKKPLKFSTAYLAVYTNGIQDTTNTPIVADGVYGVAKNTTPLPTSNAAYALQQFVNAQEGAVAARGIARDTIVLSHHFTTQSRDVMTRGVLGTLADAQVKAVITGVVPTAKPTFNTTFVFPFGALRPDLVASGANNVSIRFGEMTVPYFSKPTTQALLPNSLSLDPGPVLETWKASTTIPGTTTPNPFCDAANPQYCNTNYAIPAPRLQGAWVVPGFERIPVLLMVPAAASGCTKPSTGWPIAIFQHGITGNRTNALGISIALNTNCSAVIAIDQPLHGITATDALNAGISAATGGAFQPFRGYAAGTARERTFGLDLMSNASGSPFSGTNVYGAGVPGDGQADSSGSWFINLYSLGTTRDNLRQAVSDLLALKLAIPVMDYDNDATPDFDASKIRVIGQSLGGIAATTFSALDQLPAPAGTPKLTASVLNVPGGGLAKMLDGSMAFGPRIRAGLTAGGVVAGTAGYEQFLWLAQTIIDSGDPLNYADILAGATTYPVLVQSVVGTGATFPMYSSTSPTFVPSDLVVPNATVAGTFNNPVIGGAAYTVTSSGPLAGTEPLVTALNIAATATPVAPSTNPVRAFVRFAVGHHSVLLSLDADGNGTESATEQAVFGPARTEMQTQAVSFLMSGGRALPIGNAGTIVRVP